MAALAEIFSVLSFPHPLLPVAACPQGAESEYCGEAINPTHLSFIEKLMGYQKNYNPEAAASEAKL